MEEAPRLEGEGLPCAVPPGSLSMSFLFPVGTPAEIAARVEATVTGDDRQQWQQGTPADWALESLAIVRAQVTGCLRTVRSTQVTRTGHAL